MDDMDELLRVEQDVSVLRADNDPKPQKVEVKRVNEYDKGRAIGPAEFQAMQRQQQAQYSAQIARQQAPIGYGLGAPPYTFSPLEALFRRLG